MRLRRNANKMLVEPPGVATGDIAFNLLVFFLVCASSQPNLGRRQEIPSRDKEKKQTEQVKNVEVSLERTNAFVNGKPTGPTDFASSVLLALEGKVKPEDRIVVVKSAKDLPYDRWIEYTRYIEDARGVVTLQLEEEQTVIAN